MDTRRDFALHGADRRREDRAGRAGFSHERSRKRSGTMALTQYQERRRLALFVLLIGAFLA
ncbi:MAG: hypothetical protein ABJD38_20665, partial [Aurantimonas coralicida]